MATYNGSSITSGPVKQLVSGVNVAIGSTVPGASAAAGDQINILRLPPGAEVVDVKLKVTGSIPGAVAVKDSEGNQYVNSATPTTQVQIVGTGSGFGTRLTGSANLYADLGGLSAAQAGTESTSYQLIASYLSEKDGD